MGIGLAKNAIMLEIDLGAVAHRAMWGYGVGPPSDTFDHVPTCSYVMGQDLPCAYSQVRAVGFMSGSEYGKVT